MIRKTAAHNAQTSPRTMRGAPTTAPSSPGNFGPFFLRTDSGEIQVLVNEARRSRTSALHADMDRALPRNVRIGFTVTPTIMGAGGRPGATCSMGPTSSRPRPAACSTTTRPMSHPAASRPGRFQRSRGARASGVR
ncbi:MAG: hypothetical protein ABIO70_11875 [Pseudomonadota bacterium]